MLEQAKRVAGFLLFDLVWLSAVAGRAEWVWATIALVLAQLAVTAYSGRLQWVLYIQLVFVGLLLELAVGMSGLIAFDGGLLPPWLILLWLGYVAMAMTALDWLKNRFWLAVALGVIFGPMTYYFGAKLGAATVPGPEPAMLIAYAIGWGAYMALFVKLMRRRFVI